MIEQDTIKLLRECDAGVKMGVDSIDDVLDDVKSEELKKCLNESKEKHIVLKDEIQELLDQYHDDGKEPNPIAKGSPNPVCHHKTRLPRWKYSRCAFENQKGRIGSSGMVCQSPMHHIRKRRSSRWY